MHGRTIDPGAGTTMRVTIVAGPDAAALSSALAAAMAARASLALVGAPGGGDPAGRATRGVDARLVATLGQARVVGCAGRALVVVPPGGSAVAVAASVLSLAAGAPDVSLDGIVCAFDGPAVSTRLATGADPCPPGHREALAMADVVAIGRSGRLTGHGRRRVAAAVRAGNGHGRLAIPGIGRLPVSSMVDLQAWRGRLPARTATQQVHRLEPSGPVEPVSLTGWYAALAARHPGGIWRAQGQLRSGDGLGFSVRGAGSVLVMSAEGEADEAHGGAGELALVGQGFDGDELRRSFRAQGGG
jgi:G3E family GTPase